MKNIFRIATMSVLVTFAAMAFAQTAMAPTSSAPTNGVSKPHMMLTNLGLNESQATQVLDIYTKTMSTARMQKAQMEVTKAQIKVAMAASSPDVKALNALVDKKAQQQADLEKLTLGAKIQVHLIVGDEIFYEMEKAMKKHDHSAWQGSDSRRGNGPGADRAPRARPGMESDSDTDMDPDSESLTYNDMN